MIAIIRDLLRVPEVSNLVRHVSAFLFLVAVLFLYLLTDEGLLTLAINLPLRVVDALHPVLFVTHTDLSHTATLDNTWWLLADSTALTLVIARRSYGRWLYHPLVEKWTDRRGARGQEGVS